MELVSEQGSMRSTDKIPYLEFKDFVALYPPDSEENVGKGSYGEVFLSGEYAIKKYREDYLLEDFIAELNNYSSNIHPCLLRPVGWTVNYNKAYLALPKGEDIIKAYKNGKITLEKNNT